VAGAPEAVQRCLPLFDVLAQRSFVVGHEPPKANLVKLSGNFLIEALGEAFALFGKAGIDRAQFLDVLTNTLFGAPIYKTYGGLISVERYLPAGFKAELGYKDIRLALAAAEALKVPMPLASLIATRLLTLIAQGEGHLDWRLWPSLPRKRRGSALLPSSR
jgi:3-hydroxyisobutyrate dehydrogenase-like beta-hydroxyacid dehydrogenase